MVDTPKSLIEHEHKYISNSWKQYTIAELGQWVHLLMKRVTHRKDMGRWRKDLADAQNYLNMMQAHIDAAKKSPLLHPAAIEVSMPTMSDDVKLDLSDYPVPAHIDAAKPGWEEKLPPLEDTNSILAELPMVGTSEPTLRYTPEGPPRDDQGNITRISTQPRDPGFDPDVHENLELKIFCNDVHIPTAHTADVTEGTVWYYEKNARGRIKTLTKYGIIKIQGLK